MALKHFTVAAAAMIAGVAAAPSSAATCIGSCGNSGPDGSVTVAPTGNGTYDWVSTYLGLDGAGQIAGFEGSATNGSELISDSFFAAVGQKVTFFFNYVTSDGSGYADYAFAQLLNANTGAVAANLFTARTKPSGTIVPGQDLPALEATLSPAEVPIIPGAPSWSPLGPDSGTCFSSGCGYTGWIQSVYTITDPGSYQLRFGATNWSDNGYDSGLAFSGLLLDGSVIGDGSTPSDPLLPGEIGENGEFLFEFTPTPNTAIFIDPEVAVGYDYQILSGDNSVLQAIFPQFAFDADGYTVGSLDGSTIYGTNICGFGAPETCTFAFAPGGVQGFKLTGIDADGMLDPTNPTAFVTGLVFENANKVSFSQTPLTENVMAAVPEPATWAMMIAGFGFVGGAMRRRRAAPPVFA